VRNKSPTRDFVLSLESVGKLPNHDKSQIVSLPTDCGFLVSRDGVEGELPDSTADQADRPAREAEGVPRPKEANS
jgi:hypothetical protein